MRLRKKLNSWVPPRRFMDNLTPVQRIGEKMVNEDHDHVYKIEDKGSSIVRIKKEWYEKNVKNNLENESMYEKLDVDPTIKK